MKNKLNWQLLSSRERHSAIEALKATISHNDGYILNFRMFSDLALSLQVEIEEQNILSLYSEINEEMRILDQQPENLQS